MAAFTDASHGRPAGRGLPVGQVVFLLKELVKRDFQGRYAGSLLSIAWSFVQPLFLLALFTLVFSVILELKVSRIGSGTESFGLFLFCGLLPWTAIHEGVSRGATAITDNSEIVKKLRFPSEVLVLSVVTGALLHQAIAGLLFVVVLAAMGELAWASLPWLLVAVPLQLLLTIGLALMMAATHVFFRDTAQVLGMFTTTWFYLTPIVYPLAMVPEGLGRWIAANPLTPLVGLYRSALLGKPVELGASFAGLVVAALALAVGGLWFFRRLRSSFVDGI